jgi:hypothetical protein
VPRPKLSDSTLTRAAITIRNERMATTAVFAEILIIGLQVEAWLVLALLSLFGTEWVDFPGVKDYASLFTVCVLALAYVLGIIVDRLADTLLDRFEKTEPGRWITTRMRKKSTVREQAEREQGNKEKLSRMRMRVMDESDGMARFLDYQRSRWRIARATVLNLLLIGVAAAISIWIRSDHSWFWGVGTLVCTLVLVPVSYFAAVRIQDAWVGRLVDAYEILREKPRK